MTPETAKFRPKKTAKVKSFTEMPKNGAMSRGASSMMAGMDDKNLTDPTGSKGGRRIGSYAVY